MNMDKLWGYACSGELENLKEYYENGGETNRRYFKFNRYHSLIAGAYRNGNIETVKYLVSVGETITAEEETEIRGFLNRMDKSKLFVDNLDYLERFMMTENWADGNTPKQARAIFTTACIVGELQADTLKADSILKDLYKKAALEDLISYDDFENFMYELLV